MSEPVTIAANPGDVEEAQTMVGPDVTVVEIPSDDAWMRDIGPTFVVNDLGLRRGVDWEFNAWGGALGGLYDEWANDDAMAAAVCARVGVERYRAPFVLEGGAIHSDGEGTLLVTEECLLNPNRNPTMSRADIEAGLRASTGCESVIWLGLGVVNDETDGHVDNLACFVRPGVVVLTWTDDRSDPQYERSLDARRRLDSAVDAHGRSLEVHVLHQPGPLVVTGAEAAGVQAVAGTQPRVAGTRLAASYVNYYPANDCIVMPSLDAVFDASAQETLEALFPGRQVEGVAAREILLGGGNIHCITQPVPLGKPAPPVH